MGVRNWLRRGLRSWAWDDPWRFFWLGWADKLGGAGMTTAWSTPPFSPCRLGTATRQYGCRDSKEELGTREQHCVGWSIPRSNIPLRCRGAQGRSGEAALEIRVRVSCCHKAKFNDDLSNPLSSPNYYKRVKISAIALIKMVLNCSCSSLLSLIRKLR